MEGRKEELLSLSFLLAAAAAIACIFFRSSLQLGSLQQATASTHTGGRQTTAEHPHHHPALLLHRYPCICIYNDE
jgi:hypothetical protein